MAAAEHLVKGQRIAASGRMGSFHTVGARFQATVPPWDLRLFFRAEKNGVVRACHVFV